MLIILIIVISCQSIDFKQSKSKVVNPSNGNIYVEEYYVISDKIGGEKQKHGRYKKFKLKEKEIIVKGKYKHGRKYGKWRYYHNGDLIQIYNYSEKNLLYKRETEHNSIKNRDTYYWQENKWTKVDEGQPPIILGGEKTLSYELYGNIEFPKTKELITLNEIIIAEIELDEAGKIEEINLSKKVGGGWDEELQRVMGVIKDNIDLKILPGKIGRVNVKTKIHYPIRVRSFQGI